MCRIIKGKVKWCICPYYTPLCDKIKQYKHIPTDLKLCWSQPNPRIYNKFVLAKTFQFSMPDESYCSCLCVKIWANVTAPAMYCNKCNNKCYSWIWKVIYISSSPDILPAVPTVFPFKVNIFPFKPSSSCVPYAALLRYAAQACSSNRDIALGLRPALLVFYINFSLCLALALANARAALRLLPLPETYVAAASLASPLLFALASRCGTSSTLRLAFGRRYAHLSCAACGLADKMGVNQMLCACNLPGKCLGLCLLKQRIAPHAQSSQAALCCGKRS